MGLSCKLKITTGEGDTVSSTQQAACCRGMPGSHLAICPRAQLPTGYFQAGAPPQGPDATAAAPPWGEGVCAPEVWLFLSGDLGDFKSWLEPGEKILPGLNRAWLHSDPLTSPSRTLGLCVGWTLGSAKSPGSPVAQTRVSECAPHTHSISTTRELV